MIDVIALVKNIFNNLSADLFYIYFNIKMRDYNIDISVRNLDFSKRWVDRLNEFIVLALPSL